MKADASDVRPAPLAGRTVLDLSRVLAGPWCTMILGDLGAEVIKVEHPAGGDDTRHWGPPYVEDQSAYYLCANRNKRSIGVDLSTAQGRQVVRALAARSDVLVENYKTGGLERFGLDYAAVARANPAIVYVSISGYGRQSPIARRPGYDYVIQAEGGLMATTGPVEGPPMKAGVAVADLYTGMAAAQAVLAALMARDRDGVGQHVDMALFDCQLAMMANVGAAYLASGEEPGRYGNGHQTVVPYGVLATADGSVVVAVGNDRQFAAFCREVIGRPALADDVRFATNASRVAHRTELLDLLGAALLARSTAEWLAAMRAHAIPCGEVRGVGAALRSPEAQARGMVATVAHPSIGPLELVASPLKFAATPVVAPRAPPTLGADSDDILRGLGYGAADIAALRCAGAVA